jgi:hypothetical protein
MRRLIDFFDSKPCAAFLVGAGTLATLAQMDDDWHVPALSLLSVAAYWFIFRVEH